MLISPVVLEEFIGDRPKNINDKTYEQLRDAYTSFKSWSSQNSKEISGLHSWLDAILETFLGYENSWWQKHNKISDEFKIPVSKSGLGVLKPQRVLLHEGNPDQVRFLVSIELETKHVGMGKGRAKYSTFVELLRETGVPLGILTNGHQLRLVYAGMDFDAWVEWEADRWFEDSTGRDQLAGFMLLCGKYGTEPRASYTYPLLEAVQESRTRQGELSEVMGEQTRRAVETLLTAVDLSRQTYPEIWDIIVKDPQTGLYLSEEEVNNALYQGSIRLVMRLVVVLFAEARHLLPTESEIYHASYGLDGLYTQLQSAVSAEGELALEEKNQAWPRLLALFRLIAEGSEYQDLTIPAYGGRLFRRGNAKDPNAVQRVLALYEDSRVIIPDRLVYRILRLLKFGKVKVKIGRSNRWVFGPVDFSDLRTEYIGMMYEGLLDYHLKTVTEGEEAIVFLNMGAQPALPLSLLKYMPPDQLKNLIQKLSKEKGEAEAEAEEAEGDEYGEEADEEKSVDDEGSEKEVFGEETEEEPVEKDEGGYEVLEQEQQRFLEVLKWARNAVEAAGLVKKPRKKSVDPYIFQQEIEKKARQIIKEVIYPGQMYLIRGSGTRKGTGTFYTKPQLAVPTVHRTLEPLVYYVEGEGENRILIPREPEKILALKVCDSSMGSGSFLVAALRYLTDSLYASLWQHGKIRERNSGGTVITLPVTNSLDRKAAEEFLPESTSDETFESSLKAHLKRLVAERCIYGVDLNSLAVELAKLSLWIETMDRQLPFEFLEHKLKVGNSLIGCWFDRFQEYPVLAWLREGGDKNHKGVHFDKGAWTNAIKKTLDNVVKPELIQILQNQTRIEEWEYVDDVKVHATHKELVDLFEEMHQIPLYGSGPEDREEFYRTQILEHPKFKELKEAFDCWCAVWFWPGDWLDNDAPTPENFYNPSENLNRKVHTLTNELKFFHWELEFPDVFVSGSGGFDAVVGNPPWEISKPKSQEFFSNYDPIYRTRGKQESLSLQKELFEQNPGIERAWLLYNAYFKSMSNWNKNVAFPFGDPRDESSGGGKISLRRGSENEQLHALWREQRKSHAGYADPEHPYRYQGSADINTYKMFLECAHALCREGGRFGFIVPSGIYTDNGTTELREIFLNKCKWEWIFGFENKKGIFAIHRSFKFCPIVVQKGGSTEALNVAFMKHDISEWEKPSVVCLPYSIDRVTSFSPYSKSILEIQTQRDLYILTNIYKNSILFDDRTSTGWNIKHSTEFHITNDSQLFFSKDHWENNGFSSDPYGRWFVHSGKNENNLDLSKEDIVIPLYEGRMIDQFDFSSKGWVSGRGRGAVWRTISWENKNIEPQFLGKCSELERKTASFPPSYSRIQFMRITSATNARTMKATLINWVAGEANTPILQTNYPNQLLSILNSFVFDYILRMRCGGLTLDYHYLRPSPLVIQDIFPKKVHLFCLKVGASNIRFSVEWLKLSKLYPILKQTEWKLLWAITHHERLRIRCILDPIIAELYGLSFEDFAWILRDCGYPTELIKQESSQFDPKGFWRVDKEKDPELRHTVLALKAFVDLKELGLDAFCSLNGGEGWMIPETITYEVMEDGTIAFDTPNGKTVPVRERLGPRFLEWQLEGTPEESWAECEIHARNILGEEGYQQLIEELNREKSSEYTESSEKLGEKEESRNDVKESARKTGITNIFDKAKKEIEIYKNEMKKQRTLFDY